MEIRVLPDGGEYPILNVECVTNRVTNLIQFYTICDHFLIFSLVKKRP